MKKSPHTCYIPVMGTGFTIDTPLKVAKYGISSVISLVDDVLIEQMRKFYCRLHNEEYQPITNKEDYSRAKRITAYLNLLNHLIRQQVAKLRQTPFIQGSEITRYFELLPLSPLKNLYNKMLGSKSVAEKQSLEQELRQCVTPGSIDVNIMTKLDREHPGVSESDAVAALRGYAESTLNSAVVFSAGFNPRLYGAIANFAEFRPDESGALKKRIILKVSDYRSAFIQGKYLAKRGLWVSEYRVESPLNCGGHAFVNDGHLMGQILEEFKQKRTELIEMLHGLYNKALQAINRATVAEPHATYFTVQGGVGTHEEHKFLMQRYELDAVGWGTPFLLVPEAVNIDDGNLQKLLAAKEPDVVLSDASPLGVPFWNLLNSASEETRCQRIVAGCPGSACVKQYAKLNTEFTSEPICTASRAYQKKKLEVLSGEGWSKEQLKKLTARVLAKACICNDLAGAATKKYEIDLMATPAICPGPNIVNFSKIATLDEIFNHIYGRVSLPINLARPHVFIKELELHLAVLQKEIKDSLLGLTTRSQEKLQEVKENLLVGIEYYRNLAQEFVDGQQDSFVKELNYWYDRLCEIPMPQVVKSTI